MKLHPDRVRAYATEAAKIHGVPLTDILGRGRARRICEARWRVMKALDADGFSASEIGRGLGRHHSTVLVGLER